MPRGRQPEAGYALTNAERRARYRARRLARAAQVVIAAGKPPKVATTAIMRKLAILANALLHGQRNWTPKTA